MESSDRFVERRGEGRRRREGLEGDVLGLLGRMQVRIDPPELYRTICATRSNHAENKKCEDKCRRTRDQRRGEGYSLEG